MSSLSFLQRILSFFFPRFDLHDSSPKHRSGADIFHRPGLNTTEWKSSTNKNEMPDYTEVVDTPILIVGGGPTGLLLAYLLSKLGVKSLIIEKYPTRLAAPKAHALSPRTLEICRQFGLDTKAIRALGTQRSDAYWVNFVTNLSGERIGVLPYERMDSEVLLDTPEMIHNIPQPSFEEFVAHILSTDPNVEVRKGVSFLSCREMDNRVMTTVEERDTKRKYRIRSKHVVGCDGARSTVRSSLGIESEGEDSYETMMTIHFNADLRSVVGERVGMLHWIMDPLPSGFIIAYDLSGNQVLISNFDSKKHPVESWDENHCRKVLYAAIGKDIPFQVQSFRPWILSRKVANEYQVGNIFLAGDAAHSFPPTGGLGLNCGLADVHNLAYKLAAVHQGWGSNKLLASYATERRHVADICSTQSVKNGKKIFSFLKAVGTANIDDPDEAREQLLKSIHDPDKQELIRTNVEGQREHFDNLELHIGYVYGSNKKPPHASYYSPKFLPGARLPHAWINMRNPQSITALAPVDVSYVTEMTSKEKDACRYSILDLCNWDSFTLILGPGKFCSSNNSVLQNAFANWNVKLRLFIANDDFDFTNDYHRNLFLRGAGFANGGGLLIRPDQHILAKFDGDVSVSTIESLLVKHLGVSHIGRAN